MISEEDKARMIESEGCTGCLQWHHHCNAECCSTIFLGNNPKILHSSGSEIIIKVEPLSPSMQWYYRLHDVGYARGQLRFKKYRCTLVGTRVIYFHPCSLLDNNLCSGHPDMKPKICRDLTLESARSGCADFELTDNCLFKYKVMEEQENETKQEKEA
jgi:hypothetical protein